MPVRLGYKASAEQFAPRALLDFAKRAEEIGLDSVWISDHFQPWRHDGGHAPFSLAWLGALGALTQRITLGTSVLAPGYRIHPAVVAQAFGTLGVLFPGRVVLGLGSGEALNEVPATATPWPAPHERTARLREAVALIRGLWEGERVTFDGAYHRTKAATIYDKPDRPVPIYVAAAGPVVASLAGEHADGLICTSGKDPALYTETLLPQVEAGIHRSGRDTGKFARMIEIKLSFDTDAERALHDTRAWAVLALTPEEKRDIDDPLALQHLADAVPLRRAASRWIVTSDPEEVVEQVAVYAGMGFDHLVFHAPGQDQRRFLHLFARHVLPLLRTRFC